MRLSICSLFIFLISCAESEINSEITENRITEDITTIDTSSFAYFVGRFPEVNLPYKQSPNDLWDGELFYDQSTKEYDYEGSKIPFYLMEKWLMKDSSELSKSLIENARWLKEDDDSWYMLQTGIRISEAEKEYLLIHYYEKISESNGGYWHSYFLEFEKNGTLTESIELGKEGLYTFPIMEDSDDHYFWARHTEIIGLSIQINSPTDIKVCQTKRYEIDGDLTQEELSKVDGINVTNDSLEVWTEFFDDECIEY